MSNLRKSNYAIIIDIDKENDMFALIHGYTGAIDLVNSDVVKFLRTGLHRNLLSDKTIENLVHRGYMTTLGKEEEKELVTKIAKEIHDKEIGNYNVHFLVTYNCNFRCVYCYENDLSNSGKNWTKEVFNFEKVDKAYELIDKLQVKQKVSKNINLYGGEPLLKSNINLVRYIIEEGVKRGFYFSAVTNGYDLDNYIDLIENDKIRKLQITIDGPRYIHDNRRPHFKDKKSFDKIVRNIDLCLKKESYVTIRINSDKRILDNFSELVELFRKKGWDKQKKFHAYLACMRTDQDYCKQIKRNSVNSVYEKDNLDESIIPVEQNEIITRYYTYFEEGIIDKNTGCQDFEIFNIIKNALIGDGILKFKSIFCGAQHGNLILDPLGKIYPCWDIVGLEEHSIGTFIPELEFNKIKDDWYENYAIKYKCINCSHVLLCGGGCIAQGILSNGNPSCGYCNDYKKNLKSIVKEIYKRYLKEALC